MYDLEQQWFRKDGNNGKAVVLAPLKILCELVGLILLQGETLIHFVDILDVFPSYTLSRMVADPPVFVILNM